MGLEERMTDSSYPSPLKQSDNGHKRRAGTKKRSCTAPWSWLAGMRVGVGADQTGETGVDIAVAVVVAAVVVAAGAACVAATTAFAVVGGPGAASGTVFCSLSVGKKSASVQPLCSNQVC